MKRRGSTLKDYFKSSKEDHPYSHIQIIGGGEFRKKGSNVKNWKIRSYYVKEDATLMYFDPITKEPKGVINVTEVAITEGPNENLHTSGCSDFSIETGVSLVLTILSESRKMEVVFDTLKEAQKFCLLLGYVATASNLVEFVNQMKWDHIAIALQDKYERNNQRKLSTSSIDSSQHSQIRSHLSQLEENQSTSRLHKKTLTIDDVSGRTITSEEIKSFLEHEKMDRVTSDAELDKLGSNNNDVANEVEIFIKKKPTIAELAASERLHEKESGYIIQSSDDEGDNEDKHQSIHRSNSTNQSNFSFSNQKETPVKQTRNATLIHYGYFYKQGHVRKNWKQRYFELWSTGVLLYKESKDSVVSRGQIDLKSSSLTRIEIMMTPSDDKFSLMNSSVGSQRVMALELKQATDKRIFYITFDINSPSRNSSLLEQFEVALKRISLDSSLTISSPSTQVSSLPSISTVIHDTYSPISSQPSSTYTRNRSSSNSNSIFGDISTIKKYSLLNGFKIIFQIFYDYIIHKKQFNWKLFFEVMLSISQIISDFISEIVKGHKDMVLLCGAPIFLYSLFSICTRPGIISIFIFCCITSFFGVHYSNIPGLPIQEGEEDDDKDSKIEE